MGRKRTLQPLRLRPLIWRHDDAWRRLSSRTKAAGGNVYPIANMRGQMRVVAGRAGSVRRRPNQNSFPIEYRHRHDARVDIQRQDGVLLAPSMTGISLNDQFAIDQSHRAGDRKVCSEVSDLPTHQRGNSRADGRLGKERARIAAGKPRQACQLPCAGHSRRRAQQIRNRTAQQEAEDASQAQVEGHGQRLALLPNDRNGRKGRRDADDRQPRRPDAHLNRQGPTQLGSGFRFAPPPSAPFSRAFCPGRSQWLSPV